MRGLLVFGQSGQVARELAALAPDARFLGRASADLTDPAACAAAIRASRPLAVINAAAYTAVDRAETDAESARLVNAASPGAMAEVCAELGVLFLHVSTDYVFDGDAPRDGTGAPRPWVETDPVAPRSVYGASKLAGERLVTQTLPEHVIVRTAWLAGAGGGNFVRTMLRVGRERGALKVVDDQVGSPTFTADLAPALRHLAVARRPGTYHVVNAGQASWFDLASATFELAGLEVDLTPQPSSALDRPAPRPAWSVLDTRHARLTGVPALPHWREGLTRLLAELADAGRAEG